MAWLAWGTQRDGGLVLKFSTRWREKQKGRHKPSHAGEP